MENIKNEWPTFDFAFEFPEARDFQFVSFTPYIFSPDPAYF
jgi:hypothetical protein